MEFFIKIIFLVFFNKLDIFCIKKGLDVVRAPIHKISILYFIHNKICSLVATSTANFIFLYFFLISLIHFNPLIPIPSNKLGLVRGFHIPALNTLILYLYNSLIVLKKYFFLSILQGPHINKGLLKDFIQLFILIFIK
ncbi:MAG: hypothetical protein ABNO52_00255 [Candidatus Shikimatogenerans sp. Tser]|uniref:Uncharacterized protein n=1 Tax=Candidatus Shikimatogenerans sp. Tser TaxID=3158568 RepID=A0AAU7QQT9_9FLAO